MFFFALAPDGLTVLDSRSELIFLDPRKQNNPSMKAAMETILNNKQGTVRYTFEGVPRTVDFSTSGLIGWRYALGVTE